MEYLGALNILLNYILITDQKQIANTGYYLQYFYSILISGIYNASAMIYNYFLLEISQNVEVYYSFVVGIGKLHYILCLSIIRCLYFSADNCLFLQPAPARINKFK